MQLRLTEDLQLTVALVCCLTGGRAIGFMVALLLLILRGLCFQKLDRYIHTNRVFAGVLTAGLGVQFIVTFWKSHVNNTMGPTSFFEPLAILVIVVLSSRASKAYESVSAASRDKYVVPLYLFALSLLQNQQSQTNSIIQLAIFGCCCLLLKFRNQLVTTVAITLVKCFLVYQTTGVFLFSSLGTKWFWLLPLGNNNLFVLVNLLASIMLGDMLTEPLPLGQPKETSRRVVSEWLPASAVEDPNEYIELKELRRSLLDKQSQPRPYQPSEDLQGLPSNTTEQHQSYNLVLLLPFFLFRESLFELPCYLYIIVLEYAEPSKPLKYLMYCSAWTLYVNHQLADHRYVQLLSISLVLMMHWRVDEDDWLANLRALWLRWCFVLVLAVLCWFGLKEVNLFHLGLMTVLLLFITRGSESGGRSFRNRNWKWLLLMFNLFVVARYAYSLVDGNARKGSIVELLGLSKDYNGDDSDLNFNLLPLVMLTFVVLQYWTYNSRTYQEKSKNVKEIFRSYLVPLRSLSFLLQVIYYKTILWGATLLIIGVLLLQDFSVTSSVLLLWVLVLFVLQACQAPPRLLNKLWLVLSRLVAFQILVRYFFEFTKYKLLNELIANLPVFKFLVSYQRFLGLSVDYPSTLYLHTVTKFQLTIVLDLVMVFLAFLAMEYLSVLIRGSSPASQDPEDQKANEIYHNYVLFSITNLDAFSRVRWVLRYCSRLYVSSFYLIIAVYACFVLNTASLLLLLVFCVYYQKLSSFQHGILHEQIVLSEVTSAYKNWLETFRIRISSLQEDLTRLEETLTRGKLKIHQGMRKYISFLLVADLFLVYLSELFLKKEATELFAEDTLTGLQWLLYLYGTSRLRTGGYIRTLAPYLVLCTLLIIELKVCKFLERLADLEYRRSQRSQISNSPLSIEPKLRERHSPVPEKEEEHLNESMTAETIKQLKSETSMKVSLQLAANKLVERVYVMLLVLCSTLQVTPESISYVLIAFLLNHYGTKGLLLTFRCLSLVVIAQYSAALANFQNTYVYDNMPEHLVELSTRWNPLRVLGFNEEWIDYLSFGKDATEQIILFISVGIIASLPLYNRLKVNTSKWIVRLLGSARRPYLRESFHLFFKNAYRYIVVLSPLFITLTSVALYLTEFTLPNLFLCVMSVAFLLRQYLADELSDRQHSATFWKAYFRLLQGAIIVFLLGYYVIAMPIYREYCIEILCSPLSARSKLTKALLVFLFQLGIDLLKSSEYTFHMDKYHEESYRRARIIKVAIAQRQNDRKLEQRFRVLDKRSHIHSNLEEVMSFLDRHKRDPTVKDIRREMLVPYNVNFMNSLLEFLANLIDPLIMKPRADAELYLEGLNLSIIKLMDISREGLGSLPAYYDRQFFEEERTPQQLQDHITTVRRKIMLSESKEERFQPNSKRESVIEQLQESSRSIPMEIEKEVRQTVIVETAQIEDEGRKYQTAAEIKSREQRRYSYLLMMRALLSNWQLLTFLLMIVEFGTNCGLLMVYYPLGVFLCGIEQQYMASKTFWRVSFLWTMGIIVVKSLLGMRLILLPQLSILVGEDTNSLLCEFLLLTAILFQSFLMHSLGLFKESVPKVEPMKMALIRNMLLRESPSERLELSRMLDETREEADSFLEQIFWKGQHKPGYDYSTFVISVELACLAYCFLFYDRMYLDASVKVNSVVEYNQFTGGMVGWMLLQLAITLLDRFIVLLNLRDYGGKWDCSLVLKYSLQVCVLAVVHYMMVWFIPQRSASHSRNLFAKGFYMLYCIYFLLSALQVRDGIDRTSRGFMDRYVWYNGYVYTALRVIPFLFEFKVFSDWFVSKTTMRLFDWIKFEDLFGRLFVAKCNSLFLQGKIMGSKIEWWKKWLMGCPLLLVIVLLIFGPLVLFSSLNPLAAPNNLVGGSTYLTLKINSSNEYPLFMNSHISSIRVPTDQQFDSPKIESIIDNYNVEKQTVQLVNLEAYSDTYWEISQGSEKRLLEQPDDSVWELLLTIKFYRQHTSATPIFTLNSARIPTETVPEFKQTLMAKRRFQLPEFYHTSIRLDNNNGLHILDQQRQSIVIFAERGQKSQNKYWVIEGGLTFLVVSDKYSQAIFGYSVVGFYISIILVVANYFRFIFQGGANLIGLTDIPMADPLLTICEAIYLARLENDLQTEDRLYWTLIDLVRSPDTVKLLTGNYLEARLKTKQS